MGHTLIAHQLAVYLIARVFFLYRKLSTFSYMTDRHKALTEKQLENLGNRIRTLRKKLGYSSAEQFANDKGINRVQFQRYETGKNMEFATLVIILDALGTSFQDFFAEGFDADAQMSSDNASQRLDR